jgi:DNA-binding NarL/FixJ family response regulator
VSIRALVVDDQAMVRAGFRMILEEQPDITVVSEAGGGHEAVANARASRPDVVLMDVRMEEGDGIAATREITAAPDPPRVLVVTTFDLDEYVYAALRAGASGFLLKDAPPEQLVDAVRIVARGDALLAPSVTSRLIAEFTSPIRERPPAPEGFDDLTPREMEVWKLVARGLSNREIAAELFLGENTVKSHVGHLFMKLGLRDRAQAVVLAYECQLVRAGE